MVDDKEPDEPSEDEDDDAQDDLSPGDAYTEEHLSGRPWKLIAETSLSLTYAMEIHGAAPGVLMRTVGWGCEAEYGVALVFIPGISLRDLSRSKPEKKR